MKDSVKRSRLGTWFFRMVINPGKELDFLDEEQVTSPGKMMARSFLHNRVAMMGLVIFVLILALVVIGPIFFPIDLAYQDTTQINVPPGMSMMSVPKALLNDIKILEAGTTYGIGVSNAGDVYTWGYASVTKAANVADIPPEVAGADIVDLAVGYDHVAAVDTNGQLYAWGNDRLNQCQIPQNIQGLTVKQLEASFQFTGIVTEDGEVHFWGNTNGADTKVHKDYQGNIAQIALTNTAYIALTKDGEVVYPGSKKSNSFAVIPEGLDSGVVQVAATTASCAALKEDGTVIVWGNGYKGEANVPQTDSRIVALYGGRYHYTALLESGEVISWGDNTNKQINVPKMDLSSGVKLMNSGYYQNYVVTNDGKLYTWGLRGYLLGSDDLGRDVLSRIINGGKVTMTVGAVSVIISLAIGVSLGCLAGFFGGLVDIIVMRISEVINSLPFLPFALILSAILGTSVSQEARIYIIMVVQGLLYWPNSCRLVRAQVLAARENEYVMAAKAMGERERDVIFKQILPNILSQVLVTATLSFATCMLTESSLSYLGFGIVAPTPTWGNMLKGANNSVVIQQYWWRWVFPALIFGICTISINLMGDGMRDAVDPKSEER